jgi:peptidyl-prolyl cis-trans isomerase B (cyclophilin B)
VTAAQRDDEVEVVVNPHAGGMLCGSRETKPAQEKQVHLNRGPQSGSFWPAIVLGLGLSLACPQSAISGSSDTTAPATDGDPKGAIETIDEFIAAQSIDKSNPRWKTTLPRPPKLTFDPGQTYFWKLDTTAGSLKIKLMTRVAPMHVSSTIYLSRLGFYDDLTFHRIITGFMAQGGDPLGNGRGGPGYKYKGEFAPRAKHDRPGLLSMANAGPGTDGSQFFITFAPTPHLNGRHTLFGEAIGGEETLRALESRGSRGGKPTSSVVIRSARIEVE